MMFQTVKAVLQLMRPINVGITMLSVWIAAFITGPLEPFYPVILACLSAGIIAAASNTINDYYDIKIDQINKPYRPLAAGILSAQAAKKIALLEYIAGNIIAGTISLPMFLIALGVSLLMFWYSFQLKRTVLWGNWVVSLTSAMAFLYGATALQRTTAAFFPAGFAFFLHFGREIIKDIQDVDGDRQNFAETFPIRFSNKAAVKLVWINFISLIIITILPYIMGIYSLTYFLIVALGIYPVIIYILFSMLKNLHPDHLGFLSNLLKADMLIGLLAIYFR